MPTLPHPSAVLFVHDVVRLTRFYREVAAMALVHQDDDHAVLDIAGFQLVIHALRGAPSGRAAEPAPLRTGWA